MKNKLLLHSCCGPCSTIVIEQLIKEYDVTIFYYNPNVEPIVEYEKRKEEQVKFINEFNPNIKIIMQDYDNTEYQDAIKDYHNLGEKSLRCYECYKLRIFKTGKLAKELGFTHFETTLSVSPHKLSKWILELGLEAEKLFKIKYLAGNYKKNDGYKKSIELAKKYDLYRQEYCGCLMSAKYLNNSSNV